MFCCVFCFASCLGQACCNTWQQLLACRLLLGFGIGPKTATIPIYAAESVPSEEIRGALVMTWQLCTALGIMLGYIFTYTFRNLGGNLKWRCMVGSPMVAPAILFFLMLALPESPRWHLLKAHRLERLEAHRLERLQAHRLERAERPRLLIYEQYDKAFHALRRLRHIKLQAARDLYTIDIWLRMGPLQFSDGSPDSGLGGDLKSRLKAWSPNVVTLLENPRCRRAMMSGLIVLSLQQLCGVNVFAYYSSSVFEKSLTFEQNAPNSTLAQQDHIALGVRTAGMTKKVSTDSRIVLVGFRRNKFLPRNFGALSHRQCWPSHASGPNVPVDGCIPVRDRLLLRKAFSSHREVASHPGCGLCISVLWRLQHWRGTGATSEQIFFVLEVAADSSGLRVRNSSSRSERYR